MTDTVGAPDADVELVLACYAAFARGDVAAAAVDVAADVEWADPTGAAAGAVLHGRPAVAAHLRAARDEWYELRSMPLARRLGEQVVVEHHLEGTRADGTEAHATVAEVFTVRDGRITHIQGYDDPADVPTAQPADAPG